MKVYQISNTACTLHGCPFYYWNIILITKKDKESIYHLYVNMLTLRVMQSGQLSSLLASFAYSNTAVVWTKSAN